MNIKSIVTNGFNDALKSGAEEIIPICITTTYQVGLKPNGEPLKIECVSKC